VIADLVVDPTGGVPVRPDHLTQAFKRITDRVPGACEVLLHDLRHWYATTQLDAGESLPAVATHLGDHDETLAKVYSHRGHSSDRAAADAVLGSAHALLHLIDFDEPFGYSVVEEMACGTPVIATRRGSMPELIDDGITGYLVQTVDEAIEAVHVADRLDRDKIRAVAVDRFDVSRMVDQYVAVYAEVLAPHT